MADSPNAPSFIPEMVEIPKGPFLMGSDPDREPDARPDETPQHTVTLATYAIARTPVTNMQYARFLRATRHKPPRHWRWFWLWKRRWSPIRKLNYPVVNVSWFDALAYCEWLAARTHKPYRLPTEAEWEKAARGPDGQRYPWGNDWNPACCNLDQDDARSSPLTPVDAFPQGASPYGVLDMLGNVWEWTSSLWGQDLGAPTWAYPYDPDDGREYLGANNYVRRVLRGVSFYNDRTFARCAARYRYSPRNAYDSVGFRVAMSL